MKYLIIGGVAGGATTAARLRRNDESAEIVLFEKGKYISYANCGLPYYIGEVIEEREKLFVQTPEAFSQRYKVDVRVENEVVRIDKSKKCVVVKDSVGKEYTETYDKLVISTGSYAFVPQMPGIDNAGVFTLRNVEDTDKIYNFISDNDCDKAVVIGAGFIGVEMVENLHNRDMNVSIVEMTNQVLPPIDYTMASLVHRHLLQKKVNLYLEEAVVAIEREGNHNVVVLKSGKRIPADIVIMSVGVRPASKLASDAGLTIGSRGAIVVDDFLKTSDKDIYAIGDVIEFRHPVNDKPWSNFLAGPANRQGRIVADNIVFGDKTKYEGSIGTSIAKVFDLTVASTGDSDKSLQRNNIKHIVSTTHSASHAGYYPGSTTMTIQICFAPDDGKLLGCQIIGNSGVDKRIDQASMVIKHGGTIYDLMTIEQAYAPPYSSAKDPLAIAGYTAENILLKKEKMFYWNDLKNTDLNKITLIDTRTAIENSVGTIPGAVNIPVDEIRDRMSEIPKDKPVYTFCQIGLRGYVASRILTQHGYDVYNLSGGYKTYAAATAPITNEQQTTDKHQTTKSKTNPTAMKIINVDACGLQCPGPLLKMKKSVDTANEGDTLQIKATDPGFVNDAQSWCSTTGNKFLSSEEHNGNYIVNIQKAGAQDADANVTKAAIGGNNKTFIMFSDDFDRAIATFILANGAAATGKGVSIFFTFWGLNVIKKEQKPAVQKDFFGKMFSMMLPSHSGRLKLSKFNMLGMGRKMMRSIMRKKGIDSLESLRQQAIDNGVEFIACQMSMDVMGIKKEELLDNVKVGGVATYMNRADSANVNLFI